MPSNNIEIKTINKHCSVLIDNTNHTKTIYSYDEPVCYVDALERLYRIKNKCGITQTTRKDINIATGRQLTTIEIYKLPVRIMIKI